MKKVNVLLVDDDQAALKFMSELLEGQGLEVVTAFGGEEALTKLEKYEVDVVVSDIIMPGMSGIELSKAIAGQVPVVLITGQGDWDFGGKVEEICDCFIEKFDVSRCLYKAVIKAKERYELNLKLEPLAA